MLSSMQRAATITWDVLEGRVRLREATCETLMLHGKARGKEEN